MSKIHRSEAIECSNPKCPCSPEKSLRVDHRVQSVALNIRNMSATSYWLTWGAPKMIS
jgi:hypothetical protein